MTDLERVREALEATWHDECPADYEPYPVQILNAHLKEDAELKKNADMRREQLRVALAELVRLREALEEITDHKWCSLEHLREHARNALKEKE